GIACGKLVQRFEDRAAPYEFVAGVQIEIKDEILNGPGCGYLDGLMDAAVDSLGYGRSRRVDCVDERRMRHLPRLKACLNRRTSDGRHHGWSERRPRPARLSARLDPP